MPVNKKTKNTKTYREADYYYWFTGITETWHHNFFIVPFQKKKTYLKPNFHEASDWFKTYSVLPVLDAYIYTTPIPR